jgi:hypothetical protein
LKSLLHKITGGLGKLSHWLLSFGPFGLLAIAFLDSLMIPMPGGVDAMLLLLASASTKFLRRPVIERWRNSQSRSRSASKI